MKKKTAQNKTNNIRKMFPNIISPKAVKRYGLPLVTIVLVLVIGAVAYKLKSKPSAQTANTQAQPTPTILPPNILPLPSPSYKSNNSIEAVLHSRRTRREIKPDQLTMAQLSQMLWSAQGVTTDWGGRTAPSAKSTYPLTVYFVVNNVEKLENGLYKYIPGDRLPAHQITPVKLADFKDTIFKITNQNSLKEAPVMAVITGNMKKMADAFGGEEHDKEVYLEAGHVGQNMYLQAESLKLGVVVITSFDESKIRDLLSIPASESIIYLVPFGYPKE